MDAASLTRLHTIARRLGRSELLFVGQASPWTSGRRQPALAVLREIIAAETAAVDCYQEWLLAQRMPAGNLGAFSTSFTGLSYLNIDHLLPRLAASQQTEIALLEGDVVALTDPAARAQVDTLLELKKRNLFRLQVLVSEGACESSGGSGQPPK